MTGQITKGEGTEKKYRNHMMRFKGHIVRHKKKIYVSTAILIGVLLLFVIFLVLLRINFLIGEEIRVEASPQYSFLTARGQGNLTFDTHVTIYNKFVCDASCDYRLVDLSDNVVLDNGSFNSKAYKNIHYTKDVPIDYLGYGKNIYMYQIGCRNIQTTLCPASNITIVRKSMMIVVYEPSQTQFDALLRLSAEYPSISERILNSSDNMIYAKYVVRNVDVRFDDAPAQLGSTMDYLIGDVGSMLKIWDASDYIRASSYSDNKLLSSRSDALLRDTTAYVSYLGDTINDHNMLLDRLNIIVAVARVYARILPHGALLDNKFDDNMTMLMTGTNRLVSDYNMKAQDYPSMDIRAYDMMADIASINDTMIRYADAALPVYYPSLYLYSNILCNAYSIGCNDSKRYTDDYANIFNLTDINALAYRMDEMCMDAGNILHVIDAGNSTNNITGDITRNRSVNASALRSSVNDSSDSLILLYVLLQDYKSASPAGSATGDVISSYESYITDRLLEHNISIDSVNATGGNMSMFRFGNNMILDDIRILDSLCKRSTINATMNSTGNAAGNTTRTATGNTASRSSVAQAIINVSGSYAVLPDRTSPNISYYNPSVNSAVLSPPMESQKCCIYGICKTCYTNNSLVKNPLILLHGHAFNKDTTPYNSIEIFDDFDDALAEDKLYFPIGVLAQGMNDTLSYGSFGGYAIPAIVKPTYYFETYNDIFGLRAGENASIDVYASRLKDVIDYTLYATGKSKVDIAAHSMGGLVVRRYMQLYGNKEVGHVILIGTPNSGISSGTQSLCRIFGTARECDDMYNESAFMKNLDYPRTIHETSNFYLVIGRGCDTDGVDGDGIVAVDSALLKGVPPENILIVNGTCAFARYMHGELLDIRKYPQVYEFVKEKLAENLTEDVG